MRGLHAPPDNFYLLQYQSRFVKNAPALSYLRAVLSGRLKVHTRQEDKIALSGTAYHKDDNPFSRSPAIRQLFFNP